jgi:hypothetical protein
LPFAAPIDPAGILSPADKVHARGQALLEAAFAHDPGASR